jgi:hypothetical protein
VVVVVMGGDEAVVVVMAGEEAVVAVVAGDEAVVVVMGADETVVVVIGERLVLVALGNATTKKLWRWLPVTFPGLSSMKVYRALPFQVTCVP